jgi:hypothetical protein
MLPLRRIMFHIFMLYIFKNILQLTNQCINRICALIRNVNLKKEKTKQLQFNSNIFILFSIYVQLWRFKTMQRQELHSGTLVS